MRNRSAAIQATGLAMHTAIYPNTGTRQNPTKERAAISHTPAITASLEYPSPCIINRTALTKTSGI